MHITLVEDNPGDVRWLQVTLADIGIHPTLTVFETGIGALEYLRTGPAVDLILTDWKLPVLTLPEFIDGIRAIPKFELTPIAVVTGVAYLIDKEVRALGAIGCLQKPIDAGELRHIFRQVVRGTTA